MDVVSVSGLSLSFWSQVIQVIQVIQVASYHYLIPVTKGRPETLYAFKSRGFSGEIGVSERG